MMVFRLIIVLLTVTVAFSHVVTEKSTTETHAPSTENLVNEPVHRTNDVKHNRRVLLLKPPNSIDEALKCPNSEMVPKLIDLLLDFIKDAPFSGLKTTARASIKNYFDNVPLNAENSDLHAKFNEVEAMLAGVENIEKNQIRLDSPKYDSKTTVVFNQRLPGTNQLLCQDLFTKLIKEAYDKYSQVAKFPNCMMNDATPEKQMTSLPFSIMFDDASPLIANNGITNGNQFNVFSGTLPLQNSQSVEYLHKYKYVLPPQLLPYNELLLPKTPQENISPSNIQALLKYYNPNGLATYPFQSKVIFNPSKQVDGSYPSQVQFVPSNQPDGKISVLEERPNLSQQTFPVKYNILSHLNYQPVDNLQYIPNGMAETAYNVAPNDFNYLKKPSGDIDKTGSTINIPDNLLLNQLELSPQAQTSKNIADFPASINVNGSEQVVQKENLSPEKLLYDFYKNPAAYISAYQMQVNPLVSSQVIGNKIFKLDKQPSLNNNVKFLTNEPQKVSLDTLNIPIQYDKDLSNQYMPNINNYLTSPNVNLNERQILDSNQANYSQLIDGGVSAPDSTQLPPISNLKGLPTATNKAGVIELTYALKRPQPVIYHPVYYVKYRMPYSTFLQGYQALLDKRSSRQRPDNLYRKLLTNSDIAEVSPDLKAYRKEDIVNLINSNGQLIAAKLLRETDTDNNKLMDDKLKLSATQDNVTPLITKILNNNGVVGNMLTNNIKKADSMRLKPDRRLIPNSPIAYINRLY